MNKPEIPEDFKFSEEDLLEILSKVDLHCVYPSMNNPLPTEE